MFKKDSSLLGLILGLITPFTGAGIFYLFFFSYMYFDKFITHILNTGQWISVLSLGVILNLGLFFLFLRNNSNRSARGVLAATFVYAFLVVYFKIF